MHLSLLFLLPLAAAPLTVGQSDFCDAACQGAYDADFAQESADWVSDVTTDPFYASPVNITAKPGSLIRWQDVPSAQLAGNFTIPAGLSLSRFIYVSEDIDGTRIAASAYALLPYTQTETTADSCGTKQFCTVVFAHGTAGNNPNCAPSNQRALYYDWEGPLMIASSGFAVIGPDYAGLGAHRPNSLRYMAGYLHAGDVAYALMAARSSPIGSLLSQEWVVAGHSEGGMTAWRVNERLALADQSSLRNRTGEFLGAVAAAPAMRAYKQPPPMGREPQPQEKSGDKDDAMFGTPYPVMVFEAYSEAFPNDIKPEDYLTDLALARLKMNKGCYGTTAALFENLSKEQIFKNMSWEQSPRLVEWSTEWVRAGIWELAAPMLVVSGLEDPITRGTLDSAVNAACARFPESIIQSIKLPGLSHDECFQASQPIYLRWIRERFDRAPVQGCSAETMKPATNSFGMVQISWTGTGL